MNPRFFYVFSIISPPGDPVGVGRRSAGWGRDPGVTPRPVGVRESGGDGAAGARLVSYRGPVDRTRTMAMHRHGGGEESPFPLGVSGRLSDPDDRKVNRD